MNQQMNLIYAADTGHVLALFTRNAEPSQPDKKPDVFVGDGLHVRGAGDSSHYADFETVDFAVLPENLKLLQVAFDSSVIGKIRAHYRSEERRVGKEGRCRWWRDILK